MRAPVSRLVGFVAVRVLPALNRYPLGSGPVAGSPVLPAMGVVPLQQIDVGQSPIALALMLNGLFIDALLVGLPIASVAARAVSRRPNQA